MQLPLIVVFALCADPRLQSSDTRIDALVCGSNSLALVASYLNGTRASEVHALLEPERAPFSLDDLNRAAADLGLRTALLRWQDKRYAQFQCPAILHVRANATSTMCDHFIVCFAQQGDMLCIADYPRPPVLVTRERVFRFWDGDALYLDAPQGTRINALQPSGHRFLVIWLLVTIVGAGLILMAGPRVGHWAPRFPSVGKPVSISVGLVIVLGLAIVVILHRAPATDSKLPALEAAESLLTVRGDPAARGGREKVVFQLKNVGHQAVTIADVSTTCACLVPAGIAGKIIPPGEQWPLEVQVGVPQLGTSTQQLLVFHDGPGSPLALSVKAEGRRKLPIVESVENRYPLFEDLRDVSACQTMVVKTVEELGSEPWLGELTPDHPSVSIHLQGIREEIDGRAEVLRRTYEYTVGWNTIPDQREVKSVIRAKTAIDPEPGVFIGSVVALVKPSRFSPTVVHLKSGTIEEDVVIFTGPSADWTMADDANLPPWLHAEWNQSAEKSLRLALTSAFDGTKPERCQIQLHNSNGEAGVLNVIAYPSTE